MARIEKRFETDPTLPIQTKLSEATLSYTLPLLALEKGDKFLALITELIQQFYVENKKWKHLVSRKIEQLTANGCQPPLAFRQDFQKFIHEDGLPRRSSPKGQSVIELELGCCANGPGFIPIDMKNEYSLPIPL